MECFGREQSTEQPALGMVRCLRSEYCGGREENADLADLANAVRRTALALCVLQRGHVGRKTGNLGTEGEIDYLLRFSSLAGDALVSNGVGVKMLDADNIPYGLRCDAFLALHCDGARDKTANGFSLGYPAHLGDTGALARCLRVSYGKAVGLRFRGYNCTTNLSRYYAFSRVRSPGRAIIELGFLTNPNERRYLEQHMREAARAVAEGIAAFIAWRSKAVGTRR
ncbi:MAG: N-acetylmuramoyl-L-alanine amidase [Armatimonadota bacterium]